MPEGPEVRRYADKIGAALCGKPIVALSARTKAAKAWLVAHEGVLEGRRVTRVWSHGKNLVGDIEGGYFFYSHLMMWGRWEIIHDLPILETDRRERARITVPDAAAILLSAPVFEMGQGRAQDANAYLAALGPDILPYPEDGAFDTGEFLKRLRAPQHAQHAIGAVLLNQQTSAGVGNYLRAEILFDCKLDPWRMVDELSADELQCLCESIAKMAQRAYAEGGATVTDDLRDRMRTDDTLVYAPGRDFGTRHYVYHRTNLPCLICGTTIRQKRQITRQQDEEEGQEEKERIIYFCPCCQNTTIELAPIKKKKAREINIDETNAGDLVIAANKSI